MLKASIQDWVRCGHPRYVQAGSFRRYGSGCCVQTAGTMILRDLTFFVAGLDAAYELKQQLKVEGGIYILTLLNEKTYL